MWGCEKISDLYLDFTLNLTSYPPKSSLFLTAVLSYHLRNTSMGRVWITHKDRKECIKVVFVWNGQIEGTDHGAGHATNCSQVHRDRKWKKNWRPKDQMPAFAMISRTRFFSSCLAPFQRLSSSSCTGSSRDFPSIWAVMSRFRKVPFPVFNVSENFPVGCAGGDGENVGLSNWYSGLDGLVFHKGIWIIHILGHWYSASPASVTEEWGNEDGISPKGSRQFWYPVVNDMPSIYSRAALFSKLTSRLGNITFCL